MRRTIEVAAPWMNAAEADSMIENTPHWMPLSQRKVGRRIHWAKRLGVTNAERELQAVDHPARSTAPKQLEAQRPAERRECSASDARPVSDRGRISGHGAGAEALGRCGRIPSNMVSPADHEHGCETGPCRT